MMKDFIAMTFACKVKCLSDAGKDVETPTFALKKDEEYYPEFKTCMKESMTLAQEKKAEKFETLTPK